MPRKATATASLLSIADISRHFSLPESTTRCYCKRFAAYIPSVGEGRRRRYRHETLTVIAAILEQMQKSRTAATVEEALQTRFPRNALVVAPAQPPDQNTAGSRYRLSRRSPATSGTANHRRGSHCCRAAPVGGTPARIASKHAIGLR